MWDFVIKQATEGGIRVGKWSGLTKEQVKRLYEISKCNRGLISSSLSVALDDDMWPELSPDEIAVFIVEWLEKIKSVLSSESKNEWIEEFIKQDKL